MQLRWTTIDMHSRRYTRQRHYQRSNHQSSRPDRTMDARRRIRLPGYDPRGETE